MTIRMLGIDIDGTLLDREMRITDATRRAVAGAIARGVHVVLCTGRRYRRTLAICDELGVRCPLVTHDGALVRDPRDGHRLLCSVVFDNALRDALLAALCEAERVPVLFPLKYPLPYDFILPVYPSGNELLDEYVGMNRRHAWIDPEVVDHPPEPTLEMCTLDTAAAMRELEAGIRQRFGEAVSTHVLRSPRYRGHFLEILPAGASKWRALLHVAGQYGIGPEEIVTIGDDVNDVEMLREAGLGIAMGHAPEAVRSAADRVTADNGHEGVAKAVAMLF